MPAADKRPRLSRQRRQFLIAAAAGLAVFVLVAILMRTGVLDGLDSRVANFFAAHHRRQPFTAIAETLDKLDTWWLLGLLIAAFVGGLWWSGRMAQAVYLGVSIAVALTSTRSSRWRSRGRAPWTRWSASRARPSRAATRRRPRRSPRRWPLIAWPTRWRWPMVAVAALFSLAMGVSRVYLAASLGLGRPRGLDARVHHRHGRPRGGAMAIARGSRGRPDRGRRARDGRRQEGRHGTRGAPRGDLGRRPRHRRRLPRLG